MPDTAVNRRFCIAPMMDWSDSHCRTFWRGITTQALLYTEMVTTAALIHAGPERFLSFNASEQPLALQLGGSKPDELARCAEIAQIWQYCEVNLNVGCPSDRVQSGAFGACLMRDAQLVADSVRAMRSHCSIPVTVKHRIGIDNQDSYDFMKAFVETVAGGGCTTFIVHARKAILAGLSPKQNREIPSLHYDRVYRLKQELPELEIIINGGIDSLDQAEQHLAQVDGIMVGRAAYNNPWHLHDVDRRFFGKDNPAKSRHDAMAKFLPYWQSCCEKGLPLSKISRHVMGLFFEQPGGRQYRRLLSEAAQHKSADINAVHKALRAVQTANTP